MTDNLRIISNTEEVRHYFADLKKIPVITREREEELFKILHNKNTTENEKIRVRKEIAEGNLRFVISVAKQYQNNGLDVMDLISEGNIGLMKAIDKFNYKCGFKFISYGVWWIRQNIMSAINEYGRTIRIPSNLIQETQKAKKYPVVEDMFDQNDLSYTLPTCINLSKEIDNEGNQLIDVIRNPNEDNPEDVFDGNEEIIYRVKLLLNQLDDREKLIIEKYYGLNGFETSLEDIGEELKCTKERVRQLKDKSLKKLRNESYSLFGYL